MNKLSSTLLLIATSLLTVFAALGRLTPTAWLLVYGGWLWLAQSHGRRFLEEQRAARKDVDRIAPARLLATARPHAVPQPRTPAAD